MLRIFTKIVVCVIALSRAEAGTCLSCARGRRGGMNRRVVCRNKIQNAESKRRARFPCIVGYRVPQPSYAILTAIKRMARAAHNSAIVTMLDDTIHDPTCLASTIDDRRRSIALKARRQMLG